ncbi:MAG: glycoside hydrolase family 43 protein [Treponema sp.]|jgi:alpha-N-arabinofuranosidase|nr:glycoside hydrolase family 43 protein [Treponema sp.]
MTYRNPILSGFYPDPSVCRVGEDFYLVNSTFAYFPGLPVFHSRDLAHWEQIGNVIDRPGQLDFDGASVSRGLFAPTIRYHDGRFYVVCTLVDKGGNFIVTAEDPAGPWSDPVWLDASGIDPSLFFDPLDSRVWYVGTDSEPKGKTYQGECEIYVAEFDLSSLSLKGTGIGLWRGALRDCIWAEGPHIYRIGEWLYLLHAEGGTSVNHAVCIARSKSVTGPWTGAPHNPILTHRHLGKNAPIINVGHADLFDDPDGNWRLALLASRPFTDARVCPLGRETFLVPVVWEDGWPFIASKSGLVERRYPALKSEASAFPKEPACDFFQDSLPKHWLTLRQPKRPEDSAWKMRNGHLRLFTVAATMNGKEHPAFAGRRVRHRDWTFTANMEWTPKAGGCAGLVVFQNEEFQYRMEIYQTLGKDFVRVVRGVGTVVANAPWEGEDVLAVRSVKLSLSFFYGKNRYSLKKLTDRIDGTILSTEYAGGFVGNVVGVFASGDGKDIDNHADVLWAEYTGDEDDFDAPQGGENDR